MVDLHRHGGGWVLSAHGLLGGGKANSYDPIIADYQHIHRQIHKHVDAGKGFAPTFNYVYDFAQNRNYACGPPMT